MPPSTNCVCACIALFAFTTFPAAAQAPADPVNQPLPGVKAVVRDAFQTTHQGWSSDEVLVNDALNAAFIAACHQRLPLADEQTLNWTMLNLRKAKKLGGTITNRKRDRHDNYRHAAEIAARLLEDQTRQNIDRVLCDPELRNQFDAIALRLAPAAPLPSAYLLRKAALGLRKARRLRPELVVRIADWNRKVATASVSDIRKRPELIPESPGVYFFLDATGYLYIGEAADLRKRISSHVMKSDRDALADYLAREADANQLLVEYHAFDPDSPARQASMRRAYESELIASRKPRFNIRP